MSLGFVTTLSGPKKTKPTHLSAGLGADEPSDGAEVVVIRPDENPEQRRFSSAPVHSFRLAGQLHLHGRLTPRVSLCTHIR